MSRIDSDNRPIEKLHHLWEGKGGRHYRPIGAHFEVRESLHVARPIRLNFRQPDCSAIGRECEFSFAPLQRSMDSRYQKATLNLARASTRHSSLSNALSAFKHEV